MSKETAERPARRAGREFVPLLVVGAATSRRDQVVERLSQLLEVAPTSCAEDAAVEQLRRAPAVAVTAIVAGEGEPPGPAASRAIDALRAIDAALPVIVVPGESPSAIDVIEAFHAGAQDVLVLERPAEQTLARMRSWIEQRATRTAGSLFGDRPKMPRMLGSAPSMIEMARLVERVSDSDATALILGESGTGKELVARAIHLLSKRAKGPFVAINCAAIPETLLENELFGHEKGSYTGASSTAIGKVEAAEKGTLFLDEIGEMPLILQSKILRLLQEKSYDRIGGTAPRKADIRIIAATNRELRQEVEQGRFREDLYYRLSVVPLTLPALRERPEDISLIARDIVRRLAETLSRPALSLTAGALERLVAYRWPGNVRELENELERAAVMAPEDEIRPEDLELKARVEDAERAALARWLPTEGTLEEVKSAAAELAGRLRVSIALEATEGDKERAAEALGISLDELSGILAAMAGEDRAAPDG